MQLVLRALHKLYTRSRDVCVTIPARVTQQVTSVICVTLASYVTKKEGPSDRGGLDRGYLKFAGLFPIYAWDTKQPTPAPSAVRTVKFV